MRATTDAISSFAKTGSFPNMKIISYLLVTVVASYPAAAVFHNDYDVFLNPHADQRMFFEKMVVDPSTTRIFVSGVNHLWDIQSTDLTQRMHVTTGPQEDSDRCRGGPDDGCLSSKVRTNAYPKGLAVFDHASQLVECNSLYQGRCRLRNLHNVSEILLEASGGMLANDNSSSSVVFVGNGPHLEPVLYVATTYVKGVVFRDEIPALASLSMKDFSLAAKGLARETAIRLEQRYRSQYRIEYVSGFEAGGYAYWATRQRKLLSEDSQVQTRLVRVCTADTQFHSYTEVPLECSDQGTDYNLLQDIYVGKAGYSLATSLGIGESDQVLYGVFIAGDPQHVRKEAKTLKSAVCVYPLRKVENMFQQNIMDCYRGITTLKQLPWFKSNDFCKKTRLQWEDVHCGKDVNTNIGGGKAIEARPVLSLDTARFSAIAVNTTRGSTVAFVGTEDGKIIKTVIRNSTQAEVYGVEDVGQGEIILPDMEFSENGKFVFVLTPSKLIKMRTASCEQRAPTCGVCLEKRDPYCGWCVRNSVCTMEETCEQPIPKTPGAWLDHHQNLCPIIRRVRPDKIQVTTADYLTVELENVKDTGGALQCVFRFADGKMVKSPPAMPDPTKNSLRCETPSMSELPTIPANSSHLETTLSVVHQGYNTPLASTSFVFYDCRRHTTCSVCAKSLFPCDWCLEGNECISWNLTEDKCRGQHIVNGLNREGKSARKGPSKCPHLISQQPTLFVAAGERKNISVQVQNVDSSFMRDFRCEFRVGGVVHEKLATRNKQGQIQCHEMLFEMMSLGTGTQSVEFNVIWSSDRSPKKHIIDNLEKVTVEIYKCENMASNCGKCLTLDNSRFDCGWCAVEGRCLRPNTCPAKQAGDWLNATELCPNPVIDDISPRKGPKGGGTKLRITGSNLGRRTADVAGKVYVANVACIVVPELYAPSSEIVCETGIPQSPKAKAPVTVILRDDPQFTAHSPVSFEYVEPKVFAVKPSKGPRSGGTDVIIIGTDLDAGSDVVVSFGRVPCKVRWRKEGEMECRMGSADSDGEQRLRVSFDGTVAESAVPVMFQYLSNPVVAEIDPSMSIASGGVQIDVRGSGFSLLQRPRMVFIGDRDRREVGPECEVHEDSLLVCLSPPLVLSDRLPSHLSNIQYAFDFDGATTERHMIQVFANPRVDQFAETRFFRPTDSSLTINGHDLNRGVTERDINITVGGVDCPLTALANRVMTCKPPSKRPRLEGGLEPEVVVKIGNSLYSVGQLSYDSPGMSSKLVLGIVLLVVALVVLLVITVVMSKKKSNSHRSQMKNLRTQIDNIEMKVATECKEAFAELQTSLNQFTAGAPMGTPVVPLLDYKDYAARVLFPNSSANHPVLRELEVDSGRAGAVEAALREFHKLLMNKTFFLTMVRTMEANKYFLGKDRVYVGSLLMVVLHEKMGYCTEMLKQLLRELIEKTVEKRFQPKILFRRSESVAERMLAAWFTFLMHDYLRNYAGKKLFDLYWAIKQQMEKGPQDAVTLEARYSLSEEKLLRATFEYRDLTVFVGTEGVGFTQTDVPVRVLDCDTITQVKDKCLDTLFRTIPFSERPSAADLELEWRTGLNGRMPLHDTDQTSRTDSGGWRRLNTLAHYNVPMNAVLVLTARQASLYNLVNFTPSTTVSGTAHTMSLLSERSEKSMMSLKNSPTMSRPWGGTTSSSNSKEAENGFKTCHLVKPSEHGPTDHQEKMVTEIYLTRLLMMKGTLQKFVNDLLETIFSSPRGGMVPPCIKFMFDFMDEQAQEHGIADPEVVHAWKSNALPLRFWVNLIKNPQFLFDIQKPTKVEGCLSVVAQTLMDACSTQDHLLTKDSPSSKLLFAKDMYQYRDWVDSYYTEISRSPKIGEQEMSALLNEESRTHKGEFHIFSALNELYKYLDQYKDEIMEALEANEHAQASRLPGRLQDMLALMEADCGRTEYDSSTLGLGYNSSSRLMSRERL